MVEWYGRTSGRLGLRIAGLLLLGGSWFLERLLAHMVRAYPHQATLVELLLDMILFVLVCAGMALLIVGPALFERITVSERWASHTSPSSLPENPSVPRN